MKDLDSMSEILKRKSFYLLNQITLENKKMELSTNFITDHDPICAYVNKVVLSLPLLFYFILREGHYFYLRLHDCCKFGFLYLISIVIPWHDQNWWIRMYSSHNL
uniref:Uncharacterized protein n=1 Tax=Rhizophora mucronata TaxID=61149 RepID=A0A2P2Q5K6_RHIMU